MSLPTCTVPTHDKWKTLRNNAGGKEGLSKVNMGKKLDDFHAAVKTGDAAKAVPAIKVLDTAAKAYAAEVIKKYPKLAAAVTSEIVNDLKAFQSAIDAQDKAADARFDGYRKEMKDGLMTIIQTTTKLNAELKQMTTDVEGLLKKFKDGVPVDQAPVVKKVIAGLEAKLEKNADEGFKIMQLAKTLEQHDEDLVKNKFKESIDVSIRQMEQHRNSVAWDRKLLAQLSALLNKA